MQRNIEKECANIDMGDSKIISFFRENGQVLSAKGVPSYSYRGMLDLSNTNLEHSHDVIQWMFPLPEPSKFNPFAPLLTKEDIIEIKLDNNIKHNLLLFVEKMLYFYGIEVDEACWFVDVNDRELNFRKSSQFKFRSPEWIRPHNHNFLRITRILRCLYLVGFEKISQSFYKLLNELYNQYKPTIDHPTCEFWKMGCGLIPWNPESIK